MVLLPGFVHAAAVVKALSRVNEKDLAVLSAHRPASPPAKPPPVLRVMLHQLLLALLSRLSRDSWWEAGQPAALAATNPAGWRPSKPRWLQAAKGLATSQLLALAQMLMLPQPLLLPLLPAEPTSATAVFPWRL